MIEERSWAGRPDREIAFSIVKTSRECFWRGFDATIYEASPGFDETHCTNHSISMHLSAPVTVTSRCDGAFAHRMQAPGDIKIIPAGASRIWEIERRARKLTINVAPSLLETTAASMAIDPGRLTIAPHLHVRDHAIERIAYALRDELETEAPIGRVYAEGLGTALAAHLVQRYAVPFGARLVSGRLSKARLERVVEYIHAHIASDLGLNELADVASVSPSHFNLLFKRSMGLPVHQYILRTRVEYAARLIADRALALSDVALRAGFSSQSHMASVLRRIAGLSPGELRRGELPSFPDTNR